MGRFTQPRNTGIVGPAPTARIVRNPSVEGSPPDAVLGRTPGTRIDTRGRWEYKDPQAALFGEIESEYGGGLTRLSERNYDVNEFSATGDRSVILNGGWHRGWMERGYTVPLHPAGPDVLIMYDPTDPTHITPNGGKRPTWRADRGIR